MKSGRDIVLSLTFIGVLVGVNGRSYYDATRPEDKCSKNQNTLGIQFQNCLESFEFHIMFSDGIAMSQVFKRPDFSSALNEYCSRRDEIKQCVDDLLDTCTEDYKTLVREYVAKTASICDGTSLKQDIQDKLDAIPATLAFTGMEFGELLVSNMHFTCYRSVTQDLANAGIDVYDVFEDTVETTLPFQMTFTFPIAQCVKKRIDEAVADPNKANLVYLTTYMFYWAGGLGLDAAKLLLLL